MMNLGIRRWEMLEELLLFIGDNSLDLIVNDFHAEDDEFDYAIVRKGTGKSMNRIHLGDIDYFDRYLGDYETPEMREGLEDYDDVYYNTNPKQREKMLDALYQALIDELEAQDQFAPYDDERVNVYSTGVKEEGDEDE